MVFKTAFTLFFSLAAATIAPKSWGLCDVSVVQNALRQWHSSDRFIPGGILREEAFLHLQPALLNQLADCSQEEVLKQLTEAKADQGEAENILKIQQISRLNRLNEHPFENFQDRPIHGRQDEIKGLSTDTLNSLIKPFAVPTTTKPGAFSLKSHLLTRLAIKFATDNDHYGFTSPGILFSEGLHEKMEVVFELSSRGHDLYPFLVAFGQDQVIDMLEHLHFNRFEIENLRRRIDPRLKIDPRYWDWLANWRFKGKIRAMKGVVFKDEPILQIIADPVSALIIESLVNPWISTMTNLMTNATQLMISKGEIPNITEAGTRRVITGNFSALAALFAGVTGTSNSFIAFLLDSTPYGTVQHAFMGMFGDEYTAYETFLKRALNPALVLPDTINMPDGIRMAIRAGGDQAATGRQDSNIVADGKPLSTEETIVFMQNLWRALGRGQVPATVTNDLTKKTLLALAASGLDVSTVSLGGAFAVPEAPHGNMVYKLIKATNKETGEVFYPIKVANGAKSTRPEEKQVFRIVDQKTGASLRDEVVAEGETLAPLPKGQIAIPRVGSIYDKNGRAVPRLSAADTAQWLAQEVASLPVALRDPKATQTSLAAAGQTYPVTFSPQLIAIKEQAIAAAQPKKEYRVLVFPGSLDPMLEETHLNGLLRAIELMKDSANPLGFDKIIVVPGNGPRSGDRDYRLSPEARLEVVTRRLKRLGIPIEIHTKELEGKISQTFDTLDAIRRQSPPDAVITMLSGRDVFWSIGSTRNPWKGAEQILKGFRHIVLQRADSHVAEKTSQTLLDDERDTRKILETLGFKDRLNGIDGPLGHQIQFFNANLEGASATKIREFYDQQGIIGMFHLTDAMDTFQFGSPDTAMNANGALAVKGTEETVANIAKAVRVTREHPHMKLSASNDAHFEAELKDATQNGEFHAPFNFPRHGMKGESGPEGEQLIAEVRTLIPDSVQLVIPTHEEVNDKLVMVPFDLSAHADAVHSPAKVLRFEKNGVGSYSVFVNPRYLDYLKSVDPHKILPHFHAGWCSDFCTYEAAMGELKEGYQVYVLIDAIAGVFPKRTGQKLRELAKAGATFMTTQEYEGLVKTWAAKGMDWAQTVNSLMDWKKISETQAWVLKELSAERYQDPAPDEIEGYGQCAVLLKN